MFRNPSLVESVKAPPRRKVLSTIFDGENLGCIGKGLTEVSQPSVRSSRHHGALGWQVQMGEAVSAEMQDPLAHTGALTSLSGRSWNHSESAAAVWRQLEADRKGDLTCLPFFARTLSPLMSPIR